MEGTIEPLEVAKTHRQTVAELVDHAKKNRVDLKIGTPGEDKTPGKIRVDHKTVRNRTTGMRETPFTTVKLSGISVLKTRLTADNVGVPQAEKISEAAKKMGITTIKHDNGKLTMTVEHVHRPLQEGERKAFEKIKAKIAATRPSALSQILSFFAPR